MGGPIWLEFGRLVQNDIPTVVIWPKSKPEVELQYGGRLAEFNVMLSQSDVPHCRVNEFHPPCCKSFFAVFYFFVFLMQFGLRRAAAFVNSYRLRYTCLFYNFVRLKFVSALAQMHLTFYAITVQLFYFLFVSYNMKIKNNR